MSPYDLTPKQVINRICYHKWSIERAINTPNGRRNVLFEYDGKKYTLKQLYLIRINKDLSYKQIKTRLLHHNWDVERAITQPSNVKIQPFGLGEKIYEYNGKMYNTYELCQLSPYDLSPVDLTTRINHHGWSVERAINQPKRRAKLKFLFNGNYYSANELSKISPFNIKAGTIRDRISNGWTVEDAVLKPLQF